MLSIYIYLVNKLVKYFYNTLNLNKYKGNTTGFLNILLIQLVLIQIVNANNLTKISGIISNPINSKVYICYYNIITFDQIIVDSAQLDINGKFSMTFVWPNYNHMVFIHESINVNLYINPKDNIELEFDADNFNKSIKCYGIGGAVNNYLVQKLLIFNKNYPTSIYKLNEKILFNLSILPKMKN